jgi:hypothetical protein
MIDTVVVNLYSHQFQLLPQYYDRFSPSVENFFVPPFTKFGMRKAIKADCNPTTTDKETGLYFPRLTLYKGVRANGIEIWLRVEFSAPKMIFGNNFDELKEDDFAKVCGFVVSQLRHFGVIVSPEILANADISAIHYSKNIALTDHSKPSEIIKELSKADINGMKDINQSDFRNTGQAFKVHTNHFEFIIYDKIKDLMQSKKSENRSIDKGNESQLSLFEPNDFQRPFEVIRLEARYGNKNEIKKLFKALGIPIPTTLTLRMLFSENIAQRALKHELAMIKARYPQVMQYESLKMMGIYTDLVINNPKARLKDIMSAMGYRALLAETGSRDIKGLAGKTSQEWYKFRTKVDGLKFTGKRRSCFKVLDEGLANFKPMELKDYLKKG